MPGCTVLRGIVRATGLAALLLAWPLSAWAQVFLATEPRPPFAIGPLFVSASIAPALAHREPRPAEVTISWSLVPRVSQSERDVVKTAPRELFLLWPGEAIVDPAGGPGDPALRTFLEQRGFTVLAEGRVPLTVRDRSQLGTTAKPAPLGADASLVTFQRTGAPGRADVGTYVKIPWTPRLADGQSLVRLTLKLRDVVTPHRASWIENAFWSPRHDATISFGDVGRLSLYPLYFEFRDRVVPLARDFSLLLFSFTDAPHLKVEEVVPSSATHRPSQTQDGIEMVSLALSASAGISPQVLRVRFSYFSGRVPWQPILISTLFLALGNLTGPLVAALARRAFRVLRARVHVGRAGDDARLRSQGTFLSRDQLTRLVPGETRYDDVVRLCGAAVEERERLATTGQRTLLYRGRRLVPHRRMTLGWFAAVDRWDVEQQEVEIEIADDRVAGVQANVRRYRLAEPEQDRA